MPNWTGDDGVSDYKGPGADELATKVTETLHPPITAVQILESIHLRHNGGIEMDVLQVVVGGPGHSHAAYVITHDDLAKLLDLAGERLQEKTRKRGSKKRPKLSVPARRPRKKVRMRKDVFKRSARRG